VPLGAFVALAASLQSEAAVDLERLGVVVARAVNMPLLTTLMRVITASANAVTIIAFVAVLTVFLVVRGKAALGVWSALTVFLGDRITAASKEVVARTRPVADSALIALPQSFSFPSGHAAASLVTAGVASYVAWRYPLRPRAARTITVAALSWALLVALSRVYLGVHFATDILGGWLLAAAWLSVMIGVAESVLTPPRG